MIKIAGGTSDVFALLPTEEAQNQLAGWYDRGEMYELLPLDFPPSGMDDYALMPAIPSPRPVLGRLYWPMFGTYRFAYATLFLSRWSWEQIKNASEVNIIYDADPDEDDPIDAFVMTPLIARPVSQTTTDPTPVDEPTEDDGYIVTFVDRRYFYLQQASTEVSDGDLTSWDTLLPALIGSSVPIDTTPTEYLAPSDRWKAGRINGKPYAAIVDSAAAMVADRVVWHPVDGVSFQRPSSTNRDVVVDWHADMVDASLHTAGGLLAYDENTQIPYELHVYFYDPDNQQNPNLTPEVVTFPTSTFTSGVSTTAWLDIPNTEDPGNLTAAAEQYRDDWYEWQLVPLDAAYSGAVIPPASAFIGHFEIHQLVVGGKPVYQTRVRRPPANYGPLFGRGWRNDTDNPTNAVSKVVRIISSTGTPPDHTVIDQIETGGTLTDDGTDPEDSYNLNWTADGTALTNYAISTKAGEEHVIIPAQAATPDYSGWVTTTTQDFGGDKGFTKIVVGSGYPRPSTWTGIAVDGGLREEYTSQLGTDITARGYIASEGFMFSISPVAGDTGMAAVGISTSLVGSDWQPQDPAGYTSPGLYATISDDIEFPFNSTAFASITLDFDGSWTVWKQTGTANSDLYAVNRYGIITTGGRTDGYGSTTLPGDLSINGYFAGGIIIDNLNEYYHITDYDYTRNGREILIDAVSADHTNLVIDGDNNPGLQFIQGMNYSTLDGIVIEVQGGDVDSSTSGLNQSETAVFYGGRYLGRLYNFPTNGNDGGTGAAITLRGTMLVFDGNRWNVVDPPPAAGTVTYTFKLDVVAGVMGLPYWA